jgi:NAD(P)-dependent dehydrogenase (short-subunit alcohol dehydrogenase family)
MSQHLGTDYQQVVADAAAGYPLRRIASPADIGGAIVGLVTGGDFVTGQTLIIDGGMSLC